MKRTYRIRAAALSALAVVALGATACKVGSTDNSPNDPGNMQQQPGDGAPGDAPGGLPGDQGGAGG